MAKLILDSLEINNFRTFRHLSIERLGRVNLITGKNGVGKSALLEAVWLYARRAAPSQIVEVLELRDELRTRPRVAATRTDEEENQVLNFRHLFCGRSSIEKPSMPIRIGPVASSNKTLMISIRWYTRQKTEEGSQDLIPVNTEEIANVDEALPYIIVTVGDAPVYRISLSSVVARRIFPAVEFTPSRYVRTNGLPISEISQLWDSVTLTPFEDEVISALRIIAPGVRRVTLIGEDDNPRGRTPVVVEDQNPERVSLRSLGEGMSRLFGIALALVNAKDGVLILDEVESGLHYSVLPDVFKLLFRVAYELNVQVFATTHSWDCIEAFQRAAEENQAEQAMLIRLQSRKSEVISTLFDEQDLGIATRELIEVR